VTAAFDRWEAGARYEPFIGRWSRLVARQFVPWLEAAGGGAWLDVGCGTGALAATVLDLADPVSVTGVDPSPGFVEHSRSLVSGAGFEVGDAQALAFPAAAFDVVVSALVLNFVADPALAASEMLRVTRPGGRVAAYVWDYGEGMQMLRSFWDAAVALDPGAAALDEGPRFPLCRPGPLRELWEAAGLREVEVRALEVPTRFRDFDDYWQPFLGGQGPAPGYCVALPASAREALRERLRRALPATTKGAIELSARAWAVKGVQG
jgi:SAM-dependent methyltransferase